VLHNLLISRRLQKERELPFADYRQSSPILAYSCRISSHRDSNDQDSQPLFHSIGCVGLRMYTADCCLSTSTRSPATRLDHPKMTRLRDCTTAIMSGIFMPEAWSPGTHKSDEISWDGVFAEHGW
jgi:hypothetical protein